MRFFLYVFFMFLLSCSHTKDSNEEQVLMKSFSCAWQDKLSDSELISNVLLPGTHDSGAYVRGGGLVKTQSLTIGEQLIEGVRAFDIRLKSNKDNVLEVYHGISSQGLYFEKDILAKCVSFLKDNPSEYLVFSLKREGGSSKKSLPYRKLIGDVLNSRKYSSYFITDFSLDLTVSDLRGKILVLNRSSVEGNVHFPRFNGWKDNTSFKANISFRTRSYPVHVEDSYKVKSLLRVGYKWSKIKRNLNLSNKMIGQKDWFITFTSGTSAFAYPFSVAKRIKPLLNNFINNGNKRKKRYKGLVFMDFVKKNDSTIDNIIDNNFM